MPPLLEDIEQQLDAMLPTALVGSVVRTVGMTAAVADFPAPVGALVEIERQSGGPLRGEVIGFRDEQTLVYLLSDPGGLRHGNRVRLLRTSRWIHVGNDLLGRVINAHGEPIDGRPRPALAERVRLDRPPLPAIQRPRIDCPLSTGIRAIDGLLTCGKGQRIGIFAGSGVGKSVTLGMMARYTSADVNVIALVGERGREVNEFIERDLGPALAKSVVVVATSDEPALARVQAAFCATAMAEYFRDQGRDVLLVMDSLTRLALAQREIGLAAGEPPTTRGFPPSVFALLAQAARTCRPRAARQHHRFLFRARRRRRSERADLRRRSRAARRPHLAVAQAGRAGALSGGRRAGQHQPVDGRSDRRRASPGGAADARAVGRFTATTKT